VKVEDGCVLKDVEKGGSEVKEKGRVFEGIEQTKVKHIHSGHTLRHPFEHQLKY
jgi:hypothetical protein